MTFYNHKGFPLHSITLPSEQTVPSEKIKWNPAGTIAWMERADNEPDRILDIDIDFLKIAPQQIDFFNHDGLPIGTIQADSGNMGSAVEVTGWMNGQVAVMKSYVVGWKDEGVIGVEVKDVSYFLYDVPTNKKGDHFESVPPGATMTSDDPRRRVRDKSRVNVTAKEITYLK